MLSITKGKDFFKASLGNIIEWYDFCLFGIFAVPLSQAFFPNYSQFAALLMIFFTFSISFVARPLGSLLFGYLGDNLGKYYSINLAIWCMAIPTVLIGFLPSYAHIGGWAPILLLLLRFVQGLSVGGQFSGLITLAADNACQDRPYLVSMVLAISVAGNLLASVTSLACYHLFNCVSVSLTWRVPFLLSGFLFLLYRLIGPRSSKDTAVVSYSLKTIFLKQPYEILYMTLLGGAMSSIYYILYSYSVSFMRLHLAMNGSLPLIIINCMLLISLCCFPIYGKLAKMSSNRINVVKRLVLAFALVVVLLLSDQHPNGYRIIICFGMLVILYSGITTYLTGLFAEVFAKEYRMTACSLCHSGGAALGGFIPSIAEFAMRFSSHGFYSLLFSLTLALYLLLIKIPTTNGFKHLMLQQ